MRILRALGDALFRLYVQQNWPRDRKLIQSCCVCIDFSAYAAMFDKCVCMCILDLCYTHLNRETVQQKYSSFSPLSMSVSAIIAQLQRPKRNDLYLGLGKTDKALLIIFLQYYVQY